MQSNKRSETGPELLIRRELHRRGLRFRKDLRILAAGRPVRPDIVFTRARVAVFVDGCFWHRCPVHASDPKTNAEFWQSKLDGNVTRDRADDQALAEDGWTVIRVWEHDSPTAAAERVSAALLSPARGHPARSTDSPPSPR